MSKALMVSAPGKILLTGGYIIIDPEYSGIVIAANARFHTKIEKSSSSANGKISIHSPQISKNKTILNFDFCQKTNSIKLIDADFNLFNNDYVIQSLKASFDAVSTNLANLILNFDKNELLESFDLTLYGDEQFYSPIEAENTIAAKTGLGSSAAMCSSLVMAVFLHFREKLTSTTLLCKSDFALIKNIVYRHAVRAHYAAQGKIGSGFDIAAAIFGSMCFKKPDGDFLVNPGGTAKVGNDDNNTPGNLFEPFCFPKTLAVLLGDVRKGSKTPEMVEKVLKWRDSNLSECKSLWEKIDLNNKSIKRLITDFDGLDFNLSCEETINSTQNSGKCDKSSLSDCIASLRSLFNKSRDLYKQMGIRAGTEIEPASQTEIIDKTNEIEGVVCTFVPGAGGSDAIASICLRDEQTKNSVNELWRKLGVKMLQTDVQTDDIGINYSYL